MIRSAKLFQITKEKGLQRLLRTFQHLSHEQTTRLHGTWNCLFLPNTTLVLEQSDLKIKPKPWNCGTVRNIAISSLAIDSENYKEAAPFDQIPRVTSFKMIKHILQNYKEQHFDLINIFLGLKQEMGDLMLMKGVLGQEDMLITHNPDDFEKVFRNEGIWPVRPGSETMKYHRSVRRKEIFQGVEGVIPTNGEKWGSFRSKVNAVLLKPENVLLYLNKMSQVNKTFMEKIRVLRDPLTFEVPGSEFQTTINCWTLESVSVVALDRRLQLLENDTKVNPITQNLFQAMTDFFRYSFQLEFFPSIWRYIPTPAYYRTMNALDVITNTAFLFVNEAVNRIEQHQQPQDNGEKSILEKLILIDKKVAVVMAMDMLLAGVDTTSSTFFGLLLCMAKNPDKQAKLRDEIRTILPHKDSEFDKNSLQQVPFLKACIKESLRYYPLTFGNARAVQRDVVLSGYKVPKGTNVFMFNQMRDENMYTQANKFAPERWLRTKQTKSLINDNNSDENSPSRSKNDWNHNPFVYLPFGFGTRSCIGRRIVEMELQLGLARLIRNFYVEYPYSTKNAFKSLLINVPNIPHSFRFKDVED